MDTLGKRLRERRSKLKLTLKQVADASDLGTGTISDLEQGRQHGTTKLHKIANFLRVHVAWLETGQGPCEIETKQPEIAAQYKVHGVLVTPEGARVGAEWDKLEGDDYRRLAIELIEGLVAAQKRANRLQKETESASKAPIKGKGRPAKLD